MLGKSKDNAINYGREASSAQQMPHSAVASRAAPEVSSISAGLSIIGKIVGHGAVTIFGHVDGEVRASTVVIAEGAQVEGDIVAEELTIGGQVKGTLHANRVKLNSTASRVQTNRPDPQPVSIDGSPKGNGSSDSLNP
jgi:cytoskeletal protein CcmA (bactofilin family)